MEWSVLRVMLTPRGQVLTLVSGRVGSQVPLLTSQLMVVVSEPVGSVVMEDSAVAGDSETFVSSPLSPAGYTLQAAGPGRGSMGASPHLSAALQWEISPSHRPVAINR